MSKRYAQNDNEPYSNMPARFIALYLGLALSLLGFVAVLFGALMIFVPGFDVAGASTFRLVIIFLSVGIASAFAGSVLTVSGANTRKSLAQLSFLFCVLAFVIGTALLTVLLFFKTVLPITALERMGL